MEIDTQQQQHQQIQLQIQFHTFQPHLPVELPIITLPAQLRRQGLSEVVNQLLIHHHEQQEAANDDEAHQKPPQKERPFDFIIEGELLRTSLKKFIDAHNISSEVVLRIEYFESVPSPVDKNTIQQDDWISTVQGHFPSRLYFTGSYDTNIRLWNEAAQCVLTIQGHSKPIKTLNVLKKKYPSKLGLLSADDYSIRYWSIQGISSGALQYTCDYEYVGADAAITAVSPSPSEEQFVGGCADGHINVWSTYATEENTEIDGQITGKKRKRSTNTMKTLSPEGVMKGHTDYVSGLQWSEMNSMYSASWDHSVRTWDVITGQCTNNMNCSEPITTLTVSSPLLNSPITGHPDRTIRVWDPRAKDSVVIKLKLTSHNGWISSLSFCPRSDFLFCSGSYDKSLKVWDLRSTKPLYTINSHKENVLAVHWDQETILSGGADSQLKVHQINPQSRGEPKEKRNDA